MKRSLQTVFYSTCAMIIGSMLGGGPRARAGSRGIAKAKAAGVYKGRPASIDAAAQGKGASEIAKALKIGRASVYRVLEARTCPESGLAGRST
jgi:hypothetical protein